MKLTLLLAAFLLFPHPPQQELRPGLLGEYYEIGEEFDDFPTVANRKPAVRRIDAEINFPNSGGFFGRTTLKVFFCVRWTGKIRVPEAGKYTFTLGSDDGSRLLIDGKLTVNNGGLHGNEEEKGEVELTAGDHDLRLDYFQCGGDSACRLMWSGKDGGKEGVPAANLFHPKDAALDR